MQLRFTDFPRNLSFLAEIIQFHVRISEFAQQEVHYRSRSGVVGTRHNNVETQHHWETEMK